MRNMLFDKCKYIIQFWENSTPAQTYWLWKILVIKGNSGVSNREVNNNNIQIPSC